MGFQKEIGGGGGAIFVFVFAFFKLFYSGLSCGTRDLHCCNAGVIGSG